MKDGTTALGCLIWKFTMKRYRICFIHSIESTWSILTWRNDVWKDVAKTEQTSYLKIYICFKCCLYFLLIIDLFLVSCGCHQWFCTSSLRCWIFFRQAPKICQSGRTRIRTFWSPALRTSPSPPSQILTNTLSLPALIAPQHPPNWTSAPAEVTLSSSLRLCPKKSAASNISCASLFTSGLVVC